MQPVVWIKAGVGAVLLSLLLSLGPITWRAAIENFKPAGYWFEYEAVTPSREVFVIGDELVFFSTSQINRPVRLKYNDVLFCDMRDGLGRRFYSNYLTESYVASPRASSTAGWVYHGKVPMKAAECNLRSTITGELRYTSKRQVVYGPVFNIE